MERWRLEQMAGPGSRSRPHHYASDSHSSGAAVEDSAAHTDHIASTHAAGRDDRRYARSAPPTAAAGIEGLVSTVSRSRKRIDKPEPEAAIVAPEHALGERFADPDLVDRIFDYIVQLLPELAGRHLDVKRAIRDEFASERVYVRRRSIGDAPLLAAEVARMFNGRNATEVARELRISRATVYRLLKQPGRA